MKRSLFSTLIIASLSLIPRVSCAEGETSALLRDINGDGSTSLVAFGDSITFGVGDFGSGGGYPRRLRTLLGVPVQNAGVPGEELIAAGIYRVPSVITGSRADIIFLLEGANDAVKQASTGEYSRAVQKAINIARAEGKEVVIGTPLPPTDARSALQPFTSSYANAVRDIARVNNVLVSDTERSWNVACPELETCPLYNLPAGLHPNATGYDHLAQTIAATLLGIDIFASDGPQQLESALGLPAGSVTAGRSVE